MESYNQEDELTIPEFIIYGIIFSIFWYKLLGILSIPIILLMALSLALLIIIKIREFFGIGDSVIESEQRLLRPEYIKADRVITYKNEKKQYFNRKKYQI